MEFLAVVQAFEQIEQTSARLEMTRLLADLLQQATPVEARIIADLSLGQLHPPYIGTQFNLADKNILKIIARVLNEPEAQVAADAKKMGDAGLLIGTGKWRAKGKLTIKEVYKALENLEQVSGTGSQEQKAQQLEELLQQLDPVAAKYVVRMVLGKLRLGFSDMTLVDALSWMLVGDKSIRKEIEDAYNICADIGYIAQRLKQDGQSALQDMHAVVGIPIRPSAAERLPTAKAIVEKLGPCVAQPKLDGFRIQIHIDKTHAKPEIKFFSRNLQDMSPMFPDLVQELLKLDVKELICEGEAIVYDPNTGNFLPFQETVKRKRKHDIEEVAQELPLQVYLFDILYLDGKDFLEKTHKERRKTLMSLVKGIKSNVVKVIDEVAVETPKELEQYFTANIAAGLEGLVVKREDALYQPGKRNFNWIKLKRQEEGHLDDTLDCVVLGYYAGEGKRAGFGIGAFLVGVYNKKLDRFQTVAKVGTGLKDDEWKELKKKCDAISVKQQPKNIECAKELVPDVWVSPEIMCQIRADEITMSPVHAAGKTEDSLGYALRFPRFMGYRFDKSPAQATTVDEIKQLYKIQFEAA